MIAVTRRYQFPAAHVLSRASFSWEENQRLYGKCANPAGHGHNYGVEVTVTGPVNALTGRVVDPRLLDAIFEERVQARFAHRLLNDDPSFHEQVPTAENFARVIHEELRDPIAQRSSARILQVRVVETRRNSFAYGAVE